MSDNSDIEWTDATWNPTRGCTKISPGCKNCYAETFAERFRGVLGHPYEQGFDPRLAPHKLDAPLRWRDPRRVFVNSMSDLFMDEVTDDYVAAVFGVMAYARWHTFQVLTKRAARMRLWHEWIQKAAPDGSDVAYCAETAYEKVSEVSVTEKTPLDGRVILDAQWPLPNVHLGVSVEDRKYGLPRIEHLRETPAALRFLSIEPLLEDLGRIDLRGIGWVIVGGESGQRARPLNIGWIRNVVDQARAQGVPVFVKQLGAKPTQESGLVPLRLKHRKGNDPSEWPEDLNVREFPEVRS